MLMKFNKNKLEVSYVLAIGIVSIFMIVHSSFKSERLETPKVSEAVQPNISTETDEVNPSGLNRMADIYNKSSNSSPERAIGNFNPAEYVAVTYESKNALGEGGSDTIGESFGRIHSVDAGRIGDESPGSGGESVFSSARLGGTTSNAADENPDQAENTATAGTDTASAPILDNSGTDTASNPIPDTGGGAGSSGGGSAIAGGGKDSGAVSDATASAPTPASSSTESGGIVVFKPDYSLPEWIEKEGIRAGFILASTSDNLKKIPRVIKEIKDIGLNTAIVYGCSFAEAPIHLTYYREWIRLCNRAGLHVFAFYGWQPPVGNPCRSVVFSDGTEGLFPCPLDDKLWQNYLTADMVDKLAKVSVEGPQLSFEGYFLDMEMYRTEKLPDAKRNYSSDTCFCDFCFSTFIINRTPIRPLPPVSKDKRKLWLSQKGLLSDYNAYLTEQVEVRAENLKNEVRAINPKLLFGVYPALNETNWVRTAVMRVFGRDSYPVISFTTDTYGYYSKPWGADRIPTDLPAYFAKYNINGVYVAGYLFHLYTSSEIRTHIIQSCKRSKGYWLFRMSQLLEPEIPEGVEALAGGSQADYLRAIKSANVVP